MKLRKKVLTEGVVYTPGMEDGINEDGPPYIATLEGINWRQGRTIPVQTGYY